MTRDAAWRGSRGWRWTRRLALAATLTGTLSATFAVAAWLTLRAAVHEVREIGVPAVERLDVGEAEAALARVGLIAERGAQRYDPRSPAGKVLEQFPAAGAKTKPGRTVRLVISRGPEKASVPDLSAGSEGRAQLALRAAALELKYRAVAPNPAPAGKVVGQHPPAGAEGFPGDAVAMLVSAGPPADAFVMPELSGRAAGVVMRALRRHGFGHVDVEGFGGDPPPEALVTAQTPAPGTKVTVADRVTLAFGRRR